VIKNLEEENEELKRQKEHVASLQERMLEGEVEHLKREIENMEQSKSKTKDLLKKF